MYDCSKGREKRRYESDATMPHFLLSCCHFHTLACQIVISSSYHDNIPSSRHIVMRSHCHIITSSYPHITISSYYHRTQTGLEASSVIRALGFTGLIVGLTGNALDDDVANFLSAGNFCSFDGLVITLFADRVIFKPLREPLASLFYHTLSCSCPSYPTHCQHSP